MSIYYECRQRQFDGKIAVWAKLPLLIPGTDEREYYYPYRNSPNVKSEFKRWVCVFVGHDQDDIDKFFDTQPGNKLEYPRIN